MKRSEFTANWHTHNYRCRHARGDFADYADAALAAGIRTLGISDHSPTPDNRDIGIRMFFSDLPGYIEGFRAAREAYPRMSLHLGLELEYFADIMPGYADDLLGMGIEYLAAAPHFFTLDDGTKVNPWFEAPREDRPRNLRAYAKFVVRMIESGRYAFIAHPDLFGCFCREWTPDCEALARDVAAASRDTGIPLEINANGFSHKWIAMPDGTSRTPYPWEPFWRIVGEVGAPVLVNTDAHLPELIDQRLDESLALAEHCGIEPLLFRGVENNRLVTHATAGAPGPASTPASARN